MDVKCGNVPLLTCDRGCNVDSAMSHGISRQSCRMSQLGEIWLVVIGLPVWQVGGGVRGTCIVTPPFAAPTDRFAYLEH